MQFPTPSIMGKKAKLVPQSLSAHAASTPPPALVTAFVADGNAQITSLHKALLYFECCHNATT